MATMADDIPEMTGEDLQRMAAAGGPRDMVVMGADGALMLRAATDDITAYQQAGQWPRYVCRAATIVGMLKRGTPESVAQQLNTQMARQLALDSLRGPYATDVPPPVLNAPVRIGPSAVTIHPEGI